MEWKSTVHISVLVSLDYASRYRCRRCTQLTSDLWPRGLSMDTKPVEKVKLLNKELAGRFGKEFFWFHSKPCRTPLFDEWWRMVVRDTLHPKEGSWLSKILVPTPNGHTWCLPTSEADRQVKATQRVQTERKMTNDTAECSASTPCIPVTRSSCRYQPTPVVTTTSPDEEIGLVKRRTKANKWMGITSDTFDEPSLKVCNENLDKMENLRVDDPLYVAACIIFCESKMYREQWMLLSTKPEEVRLAWLKMLAKKSSFV